MLLHPGMYGINSPIGQGEAMFRNKTSLRNVLVVLSALSLIASCALLVLPRFRSLVEANKCISQAAERISVEPTTKAISEYIERELTPGLTREKVHQILEEISSISVDKNASNEVEDITLLMCSSPMSNSLVVVAIYTPDGILIRAYVDDF